MELCEEATQLLYPEIQQGAAGFAGIFRLFHHNHTINAHYLQIS